jgi:D-alanyl-lipoteichoic acid acyltransferase DltB (MBOAT superfamily)
MLFHSFPYVLGFLPVVLIVHAVLAARAGRRLAQAWLLASSIFFYGYGKPSNLPLLFGSIVFNWAAARAMAAAAEDGRRKSILQAALAGNILFLCCFKYADFLLGALPHGYRFTLPEWSLPLGISFFTLTQVMYLVDTYQGLNGPSSLFDHATMVALFPYVISGPLVSSRSIVPQFHEWKLSEGRMDAACRGLCLFAIGLTKKVVFADSFAAVADAGYRSTASLSSMEAWVATLAYSFQIYFDFSGYSDMAAGAARMLGIEIPQNFNAPYRSKSISEFWQRWHISLSSFITSYLYTPLLRSMGKATLWTSALATLLAMGIAGLWHGPAWTFVAFGFLHGAGLCVNQIWKKKKLGKVPDWLGWLFTLSFVNVTFVFFRSPDVSAAMRLLGRMVPHGRVLGFAVLGKALPLTPLLVVRPVVIGVVLALCFMSSAQLEKALQLRPLTAAATAALVLVSLFYMNSAAAKQFVYFAF